MVFTVQQHRRCDSLRTSSCHAEFFAAHTKWIFQWDLKAEKELRTGSLETKILSCLIYNENNNSLLYYRYYGVLISSSQELFLNSGPDKIVTVFW